MCHTMLIEDSERMQLQDFFRQSEQEYLDLLESVADSMTILTPEGLVLEIHEHSSTRTPLRREEIIGKPLTEILSWSAEPCAREQLRAAIAQASRGETARFEARICSQPGEQAGVSITIVPHRNASRCVVSLICVARKITKQEHEEALRAVADAIPHFVWIMRPDGTFEYSNQRMRDYLNRTAEQLQGKRWIRAWMQFLHPEDHERTLALRQHALETCEPYENEYRFKDGRTGAYRWFLARAMPVRDEAGQIVRWFGTATDIEEQKRTEEALRQSQERASVLMNSNMIGITVIEGEQVVDANDTFLRMTGYTREDLRAGCMNIMYITAPENLASTQQTHQELATRESIMYEKEYVCKDGSRLPVLVCGVLLQQHPLQGIGFVLDNSARKELEQRKDAFLSMASHELKTPLTALKLQVQLVKKRLERQDLHEAAEALFRVEKPAGQLDRLIRELLDVSKIQAGRLELRQETIDLDTLLHEVGETMEHMNGAHTIVVRGVPSLSLVGDKDRLEQVFINLLSNAIKYAPDAPLIEMDVSTSPETVTIRVRDHGMGIPKEQHEKIFERFYRAFDLSQRAVPGLGMGLYIVAEIVKQHKGRITVESEVGKGSTFSVTLPLKDSMLLHGGSSME